MFDSKDKLITELHSQLIEKEQKINEQALELARLKQLEYKFFDNSGDEESFTLED